CYITAPPHYSQLVPCRYASRSQGTRLPFFFHAEDGIRDRNVTGVQTCALPIYAGISRKLPAREVCGKYQHCDHPVHRPRNDQEEIGRATWRERGEVGKGADAGDKKSGTGVKAHRNEKKAEDGVEAVRGSSKP